MFKEIVVGTDGSESAEKAVQKAAELAEAFKANLHLVSAFTVPTDASVALAPEAMAFGMSDTALKSREEWRDTIAEEVDSMLSKIAEPLEKKGIKVFQHALAHDPAEAILEVADTHDADLIVIGSRGMSGAKRFFLGSVPNKISHHAQRTVMIVHTD